MKASFRFAFVFICSCVAGMCLHEIGHAFFGLVQGIAVVPTPAKEYVLRSEIEWHQMSWIAFGGPVTTAAITCTAIAFCLLQHRQTANSILAGILVVPGLYTLRFLFVGRGHDGLEFQEAQSAMGLNPSGHVLDILFLLLVALGSAALALRSRPLRLRTVLGTFRYGLLGLALLIVVQVANNAAFNRCFPRTQTLHIPQGLEVDK